MLNDIISYMCDKLHLRPIIGVELEFYVNGDSVAFDKLLAELTKQLLPLRFSIHKETSKNQYEIHTNNAGEISDMLAALLKAKSMIMETAESYGIALDFSAKPYLDSAGSAYHVHVNLVDENSQNLFFADSVGKMSDLLMYSIGGLCSFMKKHMVFFAPKEDSYLRYKYPDIHTPTTISWGGNNRSTALRLPYTFSVPKRYRIEHRVPGADCDYIKATSAMLIGMLYGIEEKLLPPPKIFGIASDPQYALEKLPLSLKEAESLHEPLSFKS